MRRECMSPGLGTHFQDHLLNVPLQKLALPFMHLTSHPGFLLTHSVILGN